VEVAGEERWVLSDDLRQLRGADAETARLLGPYDLFLQARDRGLLVDDPGRAKALWPVLGRPGAVLLGRELAGLWRPRRSGSRLNLAVTPWRRLSAADRRAVTEQAERLAAFRGLRLGAVEVAG
ncbi:MAG TPA: crosslink repair DNA glycosylase YcaQ family protein, partial [Pedococcus sp.]|nr:crosslink repair DNA glycosylase YcaQ family protein [Pedococcus sp.]